MTAEAKEVRRLRRHLKVLTQTVRGCITALDTVMREPATPERGHRIADIANVLEMENDRARYFGLGIDWRKDGRSRPRKPDVCEAEEQPPMSEYVKESINSASGGH